MVLFSLLRTGVLAGRLDPGVARAMDGMAKEWDMEERKGSIHHFFFLQARRPLSCRAARDKLYISHRIAAFPIAQYDCCCRQPSLQLKNLCPTLKPTQKWASP